LAKLDSDLSVNINIMMLTKLIALVAVLVGGFYAIQMKLTDHDRDIDSMHDEVVGIQTRVTAIEQKQVEQLEAHVQMEKEQVKLLEEENKTLMQKIFKGKN
jgi:septal ring factor EnvC (AmiA/AmiB activator)